MSSFGSFFLVTTFGESHCSHVGCVVDGVPPRMSLCDSDIQRQLDRRRPGQSRLTTQRTEKDTVQIVSGVEHGVTLGSPICMLVKNMDQRPGDYNQINENNIPRPSHADYTYQAKYGTRAESGGGRASARETIGRVAAGAIAEKWLKDLFGVEIVAWVSAVGPIKAPKQLENMAITQEMVDFSEVRCPDEPTAIAMSELIKRVAAENDSIGGIITCVCKNVPAGLGEPSFDKIEALLAAAMLSIPATKGFEIGSGFECAEMRGSQHNDLFIFKSDLGGLGTTTNHSGGVQGGITNAENIVFRVAFKPAATIAISQLTSNFAGINSELAVKGRHDPCIVLRAVPIIESMAALVLADLAMKQLARVASTTGLNPANANLGMELPKMEQCTSQRKNRDLINFL